ncbi:ParB/RepB/Spo0J family partition protein [Pelagibacterales bacterium SAG-MED28]|nr:ParB/RepB/Spo0J family partition protein [Pelagibacterales bacterium SAG-MED28]|tara:strand:+ start:46 stop:900 length:855 start_codon:yes stop_codon:yes gene_type:complete
MNPTKKKGLGRGLSALFGDEAKNTTNKNVEISKVSISDLTRNPYQPRETFNEAKLEELANSIRKNGIIQPIAVRTNKSEVGKYEIVAGERRWLAAQKAGLHDIPVTVLDLSDVESLEVAIVENIQRDDLNPVEEARGYKRLSEEFNYDHEHISKLMSKSRSHVSNTLRLLTLPPDIISMLEEGTLTSGQARPLIGLINASEIAEEIVAKNYSARKVEYLVKSKKEKKFKDNTYDANVLKVQDRIEKILGLKVNIVNKKNNSGKITIEYKNLDQFELISDLLTKH